MSWLREFIQHPVEPVKATHFYHPTNTHFSVPIDGTQTFWVNYCTDIIEGRQPHLYENIRNRDALQLGFDLKIVFDRHTVPPTMEVLNELLESIDEYVHHIIGVTQTMMASYFERSATGSEFLACYLKRDANSVFTWTENTIEFIGKIVFPYARIRREFFSKFYYFVLNQLQVQNGSPSQHLSIAPTNGLDTLLIPINGNVVEMYGSSSSDEKSPVIFQEMYGLLNSDVQTVLELEANFAVGLHSLVSQGLITAQTIEMKIREYGVRFWLPLLFSVGFYDTPLKANGSVSLAEVSAPTITMNIVRETGETLDKLEKARSLLNFISPERADRYWSWIDIGMAIRSVDDGNEGLKLWQWFTSQSDFKDNDDCEQTWYTFPPESEVTIETLQYFARVDNPSRYKEFRSKEVEEAIMKAIHMQEDTPTAKAFKACFPDEFVCAGYTSAEWLFYNKHRYVPMDGISTLVWYINEKFLPLIERMRADITQRIANSRDAEFKGRSETTVALMNKFIAKLGKDSFQRSICSAMKVYYFNPRFNSLRDTNPNFMATPNCVIDLRGGEPAIRDGKPQDYITKSSRYPYPKNYNWQTPAVQEVLKYISQVFRSRTLREHFWRFGSSLLMSGNNEKIFPIWTGVGHNSKSILVRLFEAAFGEYAVKLPTSLITEKRTNADSATPSLIHSRGAKVAFLQEPNRKEAIQSGTVKELTGNDTMYIRDLFQKGSKIVEMDVSVVPILVANKVPHIPDCQQAIWERTRVSHFSSVWSPHAPEDEEEQFRQGVFKMNKFFDRRIPSLAPAFLWVLVNKYTDYYNEGLQDPPEVMEATENFRVANNPYIHFTRDCVQQVLNPDGSPDESAGVALAELYNAYNNWHKSQGLKGRITSTEFKEEIIAVWRVQPDAENRWSGIRLNTQASTIGQLLSF